MSATCAGLVVTHILVTLTLASNAYLPGVLVNLIHTEEPTIDTSLKHVTRFVSDKRAGRQRHRIGVKGKPLPARAGINAAPRSQSEAAAKTERAGVEQ